MKNINGSKFQIVKILHMQVPWGQWINLSLISQLKQKLYDTYSYDCISQSLAKWIGFPYGKLLHVEVCEYMKQPYCDPSASSYDCISQNLAKWIDFLYGKLLQVEACEYMKPPYWDPSASSQDAPILRCDSNSQLLRSKPELIWTHQELQRYVISFNSDCT